MNIDDGRCEAMRTTSLKGVRCPKPADPGTDPPRCTRHWSINMMDKGGGVARRHDATHPLLNEVYMTRFYGRTLQPKLKARLGEVLNDLAPMEQLGCLEELALIRDAAANSVELYSKMVEEGVNAEKLISAGAIMTSQLQEVIKSANTAASIEDVKQKLCGAFAHLVEACATSVTRALWEVYGDDCRIAEVEKKLREHLFVRIDRRENSLGFEGTMLTPDQDVLLMDATIPKGPVDVEEPKEVPEQDPPA